MFSQPGKTNICYKPFEEGNRHSRPESDSSSSFWGFQAEFEALRNIKEKLERSANRPQWWSNHIQSSFR